MIAFVDESSRRLPGEGPYERGYLLVAAAILPNDAGEIRDQLRDLLRRGQDRLHWRDENASSRIQIVRMIASLEIYSYGAICTFDTGAREKRARAKCLENLARELDQACVSNLVLESRQEPLDQADRSTIGNAVRKGWVSRNLNYRFDRPKVEPLLWLPDALAGALGEGLLGDRTYLDELAGCAPTITAQLSV